MCGVYKVCAALATMLPTTHDKHIHHEWSYAQQKLHWMDLHLHRKHYVAAWRQRMVLHRRMHQHHSWFFNIACASMTLHKSARYAWRLCGLKQSVCFGVYHGNMYIDALDTHLYAYKLQHMHPCPSHQTLEWSWEDEETGFINSKVLQVHAVDNGAPVQQALLRLVVQILSASEVCTIGQVLHEEQGIVLVRFITHALNHTCTQPQPNRACTQPYMHPTTHAHNTHVKTFA